MHRNIHLYFKLELSLYGSVWRWFDSIVANSSYMLAPELSGITQDAVRLFTTYIYSYVSDLEGPGNRRQPTGSHH